MIEEKQPGAVLGSPQEKADVARLGQSPGAAAAQPDVLHANVLKQLEPSAEQSIRAVHDAGRSITAPAAPAPTTSTASGGVAAWVERGHKPHRA